MERCPMCKTHFRTLPDEEGMHECPKCGYHPAHCQPACLYCGSEYIEEIDDPLPFEEDVYRCLDCGEEFYLGDTGQWGDVMKEILKDFYKRYPDIFIEDFLGVKLYLYQKIFIRLIMAKHSK